MPGNRPALRKPRRAKYAARGRVVKIDRCSAELEFGPEYVAHAKAGACKMVLRRYGEWGSVGYELCYENGAHADRKVIFDAASVELALGVLNAYVRVTGAGYNKLCLAEPPE